MKIKLNSLTVFFTVLLIGAIVTGCSDDGFGSSSSGASEIHITGDSNVICINDADAEDDVETQNNGCSSNSNPAPIADPEYGTSDEGTSQQEGEIPE